MGMQNGRYLRRDLSCVWTGVWEAGETFTPELSAVFLASLCLPPRMLLRASVTEDSLSLPPPPSSPLTSRDESWRCEIFPRSWKRDVAMLIFYPASKDARSGEVKS